MPIFFVCQHGEIGDDAIATHGARKSYDMVTLGLQARRDGGANETSGAKHEDIERGSCVPPRGLST